jgi:hypothetical protein
VLALPHRLTCITADRIASSSRTFSDVAIVDAKIDSLASGDRRGGFDIAEPRLYVRTLRYAAKCTPESPTTVAGPIRTTQNRLRRAEILNQARTGTNPHPRADPAGGRERHRPASDRPAEPSWHSSATRVTVRSDAEREPLSRVPRDDPPVRCHVPVVRCRSRCSPPRALRDPAAASANQVPAPRQRCH